MKFVKGMYVILILFMTVNFFSVFVFNDAYSGIASWINVLLFLLGSIFYINARHHFKREVQ
jgi:ABC-type xylose transport system permease subunit